MSRFRPYITGRQSRRATQFGPEARRKGAGWTRPMRKGRTQRLPREGAHS